MVLALGEFCRAESIPLLFDVLEDDLCRDNAMASLRKVPEASRQFGILSVRGLTGVTMDGPSARYRRRATLQLLAEFGIAAGDWLHLRQFLWDTDPGTVAAAAQIGFRSAAAAEHTAIAIALLRVAEKFDAVQESDAEQLLAAHADVARDAALQLVTHQTNSVKRSHWLSPFFRILNHLFGETLEATATSMPASLRPMDRES